MVFMAEMKTLGLRITMEHFSRLHHCVYLHLLVLLTVSVFFLLTPYIHLDFWLQLSYSTAANYQFRPTEFINDTCLSFFLTYFVSYCCFPCVVMFLVVAVFFLPASKPEFSVARLFLPPGCACIRPYFQLSKHDSFQLDFIIGL